MNFADKDEWLSSQLGRDSWRIRVVEAGSQRIEEWREELSSLTKRGDLFLFSKVDSSELASVKLLEEFGFNLVDTNVVLSIPTSSLNQQKRGLTVRPALPKDELEVVELARSSFSKSRFHLDPNFKKETADKIKAEWIRNYFRGERGDALLVAEIDGEIAGFNLLLKLQDRCVIDLIAVNEKHRRVGAGQALISAIPTVMPEHMTIHVGTQLANIASVRFYENAGFRFLSANYVFHLHQGSVL